MSQISWNSRGTFSFLCNSHSCHWNSSFSKHLHVYGVLLISRGKFSKWYQIYGFSHPFTVDNIYAPSLFSIAMECTRLVTSWQEGTISMLSNLLHQLTKVLILIAWRMCSLASHFPKLLISPVSLRARSPGAAGAAQDLWLTCGWRWWEVG